MKIERRHGSLRYRDVDPDAIHGLRRITLDRSPDISDGGLKTIIEALKDDEWIKAVDSGWKTVALRMLLEPD